jgi:hypothetical protein
VCVQPGVRYALDHPKEFVKHTLRMTIDNPSRT